MRRSTRKRTIPDRLEYHNDEKKQRLPSQQSSTTLPGTHSPQPSTSYAATQPARQPSPKLMVPAPASRAPIPQKARMDQKFQQKCDQGMMMAKAADIEMDFGKVIRRNFVALKKYMHPDVVTECDTSLQLFSVKDRRNIQGRELTEKNDFILRNVIKKGKTGYTHFKELLRKSGQTDLIKLLTYAEKGQDTKEIENQLEKMAILGQDYFKQRCAQEILKQRQKLIQIADNSELGWKTAAEYVANPIACDSDDEKRIYKAEARASRKAKAEKAKKSRGRLWPYRKQRQSPKQTTQIQNESYSMMPQRKPGLCFSCGKAGHWKNECQQAQKLKDGLIKFYKKRHSHVFLSPLFEKKETPLASFYIRPDLNTVVEKQTRNDKKLPVKSLSEMFRSENNINREVYVIADAGLGKTAFSNHLAITWCQAHCQDENMIKLIEQDDIDCMQRFDFLFLVLLRDSHDLCSIDELIFRKIVSNLCLQEKPSKNFLLKILKKEKCLVILDGLDEWTHPEKKCYRSPKTIPHRNDQENCTVLTTTRPWKLGISNLNSIEQGKTVEITKLSEESAVKLTERILKRLKSYPDEDALESDVKTFMIDIRRRNNPDITSVPLLLIYTICLWCDGVQIGNSKCDLYTNIVELLLSRTKQKYGDLQYLQENSDEGILECFAKYANCKKYYTLLNIFGKLAYDTLFNETRENTLVFDGSVARKYLTPDEMTFTLHTGILSESTSYTLTKKFSKVSFSHKTVQEFFAAIITSSQSDAHKIVIEKCRNIQDILDMSKIFEFVSKMNADRMCEISRDLMSVINEDEKTRNYRTRTGVRGMYYNPLYHIQEMFLSCLEEMPESKNIQLCLQDFFIDEINEDSEQLQRLLKQNKTNIKSLYIYASSTDSNVRDFIDLFSLTDLSHIQKLVYQGNGWKKEVEINLLLFPSLQNLTLWCGKCTNDEENLRENLTRLQNLQYLDIGAFTLSHKILETIYNFIPAQKSMKELKLLGLDCKEHGRHDCKRLNLDLSKHTNITNLHLQWLPRLQLNITSPSLVNVTLWTITLDESSLLLSCDMVNIKRVKLLNIEMCAGILQKFISVLENLPQSVVVKMYNIEPETEYKLVRENIRRSTQTFHVIKDDEDWWGRREFVFQTIKPSKE